MKHEAPPFKMVIEAGKLIPATAYDAERLDSYRRGTKVSVRFTEEKDRILVRKWFAILGRAVKDCQTPWKNKEQASEAIKLSLGIVNLSKTVGGAFMQYPKSLTELTDPELEEAVLQMMEIIQHITGVDPDEWKKQIGDLGQDDEQITETSDGPHATDDGSEAVLLPGDASNTEPGDSPQSSSQDGSSGSLSLSDEDKRHLGDFIIRLNAAVGEDPAVVSMTRNSFASARRPLGLLAKEKAETITRHFRDACGKSDEARQAALAYACAIAQIEEHELAVRS